MRSVVTLVGETLAQPHSARSVDTQRHHRRALCTREVAGTPFVIAAISLSSPSPRLGGSGLPLDHRLDLALPDRLHERPIVAAVLAAVLDRELADRVVESLSR